MEIKKRGKNTILTYAIFVVWMFITAVASYFFPYVIDSISYLKIKNLEVEGLQIVPAEVISKAISETVKNNVVFLYTHKGTLMERINELSGDAIEDLKIHPIFSQEGFSVKILAKERKAFVTAVVEDKVYFLDEKGHKFNSKFYNVSRPIIYTNNLSLVEDHFDTIKKIINATRSIDGLSYIYVTDINTIIYTNKSLRIIMPPVFVIDEKTIEKISKLYNINMKYDVKEINFISGGIVVLK